MVGFDVPFAFLVGGAVGWRLGGRRRDLALAATGLGVAVPGLAFLARHPDWDLHYFVDATALPVETPALFCAAVLLAGLAGHAAGSRRPRGLVGVAVALAAFLAATLPRTLRVGNRADWETAPLLPPEFLAFALPWWALAGAALAATGWLVEWDRKRPEAPR